MRCRWVLLMALLLPAPLAAQAPRSSSSPRDERAAMQKSMSEFKRGVGGRLEEEARRQKGGSLARPTLSGLQIRSGVLVPDGGETLLGGVTGSAEGKNNFGAGPLQNRAGGRESSRSTASVRVWLIIFSEEEERQTGFSPRSSTRP